MRSDILPWILIISLYCVGLGLASDLYHYFLSFIFFSRLLSPLSFLSAFFSPPPPAVCVVPVSFGGFFRLTRSSLLWSLPSSHRSRLHRPPAPSSHPSSRIETPADQPQVTVGVGGRRQPGALCVGVCWRAGDRGDAACQASLHKHTYIQWLITHVNTAISMSFSYVKIIFTN